MNLTCKAIMVLYWHTYYVKSTFHIKTAFLVILLVIILTFNVLNTELVLILNTLY